MYVKEYREIFHAVFEFPHLIVVASVCIFLDDSEVFSKKYRKYGSVIYMAMEVSVCWILMEFSVWMVWAVFEHCVTCMLTKILKWNDAKETWDENSGMPFIIQAINCTIAFGFLIYAVIATRMNAKYFGGAMKNIQENWNNAQATNCCCIEEKPQKPKARKQQQEEMECKVQRKPRRVSKSPVRKNQQSKSPTRKNKNCCKPT